MITAIDEDKILIQGVSKWHALHWLDLCMKPIPSRPYPRILRALLERTGIGLINPKSLLTFAVRKANISLVGFTERIEAYGHEVFPILFASAQPANIVTTDAFDRITEGITRGLKENGSFDAVFLDLHGAMVTEDFEDPETEAQRRVRAVVGDIPVVGTFDLHGNVPQRAVDEFDALVGFRSYPHIDMFETGERAAELMEHLLTGGKLYKAYCQVPYLISPSSASTFTEPCLSVYRDLAEIEAAEDVRSITFMHGFLLSDIEHAGPSLFAYADTQTAADKTVEKMLAVMLKHEPGFAPVLVSPDAAVAQAIERSRSADKPVLLADVQDNAGGGGTSDTVWILEELVRQDAKDAALGLIYDPEAARLIHEAGEGNQITLELGGKLMPGHKPFKDTFTVEKLHEGEFPLHGEMGRGQMADMGKMAQIRIGGVRISVCSIRRQNNDQAYFRVVGIDPTQMKILVVKSTNHYRADYQPISSEIIMVEAPGAHMENPRILDYKHLRDGVRLGGLGPELKKGN